MNKTLSIAIVLALLSGAFLLGRTTHQGPTGRNAAEFSEANSTDRWTIKQQIAHLKTREVDPLRADEQVVDQYLSRLELRARSKGMVSALEVELGRAAISRLTDQLGFEATQQKMARYCSHMANLSATLHRGSPR